MAKNTAFWKTSSFATPWGFQASFATDVRKRAEDLLAAAEGQSLLEGTDGAKLEWKINQGSFLPNHLHYLHQQNQNQYLQRIHRTQRAELEELTGSNVNPYHPNCNQPIHEHYSQKVRI